VVGSGPIRIGQGIEFDYSAVQAAGALRDAGVSPIMINSNPETSRPILTPLTASTSSRSTPRACWRSSRHEAGDNHSFDVSAVLQFGGQTAINLANPWRPRASRSGGRRRAIDLAENRKAFEALLRDLGVPQPPGAAVASLRDAEGRRPPDRVPCTRPARPTCWGGGAMEVVYGGDHLARLHPKHRPTSPRTTRS
jgi:carbamoyl-phosphate synthase large subunit